MADVCTIPNKTSPLSEDLTERARRHADTIMTALAVLSPAEQEAVKRILDQKMGTKATPHAGVVLGAVVRLMTTKKEWHVPEVKNALAESGVDAKPKDIYNAIGYLTRRKYLRKIAYGRYLVEGALLETADELNVEPSRYDD